MEIGDMRDRISAINVDAIIDDAIEATKPQLIELIRSQILHAERKDESITSEYMPSSRGYVNKKKRKGLFPYNTDPYWDLNYTGDFLEKITAVINVAFIEIQSGSSNEEWLNKILARKGEENLDTVYELTEDRLHEYGNVYFYPVFMQKIKEYLELN